MIAFYFSINYWKYFSLGLVLVNNTNIELQFLM